MLYRTGETYKNTWGVSLISLENTDKGTQPSYWETYTMSKEMLISLKCDSGMNFLHWWQSDSPSASQGKKPRHIPERLLWTFNYSLSWKMEDPRVLCKWALYLPWSPEFYLIAHYAGTIANCCCFVQVLSNSTVSHISRGERIERVENVNSLGRLLNIATHRKAM